MSVDGISALNASDTTQSFDQILDNTLSRSGSDSAAEEAERQEAMVDGFAAVSLTILMPLINDMRSEAMSDD